MTHKFNRNVLDVTMKANNYSRYLVPVVGFMAKAMILMILIVTLKSVFTDYSLLEKILKVSRNCLFVLALFWIIQAEQKGAILYLIVSLINIFGSIFFSQSEGQIAFSIVQVVLGILFLYIYIKL